LRALVRRDVLNGANIEIAFDAPTKEWAARQNKPTINLYLYDIREDLERRRVQFEEVREHRGDRAIVVDRRLPARMFKLSYLVTAWTQRPEDEHRLLSATLSCFLRSDALPSEMLRGTLGEVRPPATEPEPVRVTIALPPPQDRSLSDVWTALGGELKPSLDLVITAPFQSGRTLPVGPPVTEEPRIGVGPIGGSSESLTKKRRIKGRASETSEEQEGGEAAEVVHVGMDESGRSFRIKTIPRR